jgi:hypothetical protein
MKHNRTTDMEVKTEVEYLTTPFQKGEIYRIDNANQAELIILSRLLRFQYQLLVVEKRPRR